MVTGDFEKVLELVKRYHELNPVGTLGLLAYAYALANQYDEALNVLIAARESEPDNWWIPIVSGLLDMRSGDYKKAIVAIEKYGELRDIPSDLNPWRGYLYAMSGEKDRAMEILESYKKANEKKSFPSYFIAYTYLGLGDYDEALTWLEKSYEDRDSWFPYINSFDYWEPLRSEPRFKALLKKMNLPE